MTMDKSMGDIVVDLKRVEQCLLGMPAFADFEKLEVTVMKKSKKDEFWGTSVKRFIKTGDEVFKQEGTIYLNIRDIKTKEHFLQAVAHEAAHLLDDGEKLKQQIYDYLMENY